MQNGLLYEIDKICVPKGKILYLIREALTSKVTGNFGVRKIIANLKRHLYWPRMQEDVSRYIIGCMLCCTSKPSNRNQGLYQPLLVPTWPWEIISRDFVGGFPTTGKAHDYMFVVVDMFRNMYIIIPWNKTIKG